MLMIHMSGAINGSTKTLIDTSLGKVTPISPLIKSVFAPNCYRRNLNEFFSKGCSFSSKSCNQLKIHQTTSKRWLCRFSESTSPDDEYRSSRNIAISLFRRYRNFVERGGGDNLKDFIGAGVNAYALGCTDEGLRSELTNMKQSGFEVEAMQNYGGNTGLKSKILSAEIDECILWLSIIFITILCTPQPTIVRWSSTPPVSDEICIQWKGFCAVIANAYYIRGMAWLPVKTLQLEQMATIGHAEEPSVVSSRMRLIFSTLEVSCMHFLTFNMQYSQGIIIYDRWMIAEMENGELKPNESLYGSIRLMLLKYRL